MKNNPITLTELRQTGAVADRIRAGEHIKITGHGYVFAVLIPIADYDNHLRMDAEDPGQ